MNKIPVTLDSHMRVDANLLGHDLVDEILDELVYENPEYESAKAMGRWTENIPEQFQMGELDGDTLILPRGYALQFKLLLREHDRKVQWIDNRTWESGPHFGPDRFEYRIHQPEAIKAMRRHQQGIYKAPTASGKSVTALGLAWTLHPRRAIILVDKINLVDQWAREARNHFNPVDVGLIGEGAWSIGQVTIATLQTIWSKREELIKAGFFEMWSIAVLDECHHVTAETYNMIMNLFTAKYRIGESATPDKTGVFNMALDVLGEVFHETPRETLRELGLIIDPHVEIVHTGFKYPYWGDHKASKKDEYICDVPGCNKRGKVEHSHRNNYAQVKKALIEDEARNKLIVENIIKYRGHHQLVVTDEIRQIDAIELAIYSLNDADMMSELDKILFRLTGKDKRKKRRQVLHEIVNRDECVFLSTIAAEALDVAILDVIHLVFPTSNPRSVEQKIGRSARSAEGKNEAIIIDYADVEVPPLAKQLRTRRWKVYEPMQLKVNIR